MIMNQEKKEDSSKNVMFENVMDENGYCRRVRVESYVGQYNLEDLIDETLDKINYCLNRIEKLDIFNKKEDERFKTIKERVKGFKGLLSKLESSESVKFYNDLSSSELVNLTDSAPYGIHIKCIILHDLLRQTYETEALLKKYITGLDISIREDVAVIGKIKDGKTEKSIDESFPPEKLGKYMRKEHDPAKDGYTHLVKGGEGFSKCSGGFEGFMKEELKRYSEGKPSSGRVHVQYR